MAIEISELIRLLDDDPAQRAALRRAILGDGHDLESALTALTQQVGDLATAQGRTEARLEALTARVDELAEGLRSLARAQERTESKLNALIDVMKASNDKLSRLDGGPWSVATGRRAMPTSSPWRVACG